MRVGLTQAVKGLNKTQKVRGNTACACQSLIWDRGLLWPLHLVSAWNFTVGSPGPPAGWLAILGPVVLCNCSGQSLISHSAHTPYWRVLQKGPFYSTYRSYFVQARGPHSACLYDPRRLAWLRADHPPLLVKEFTTVCVGHGGLPVSLGASILQGLRTGWGAFFLPTERSLRSRGLLPRRLPRLMITLSRVLPFLKTWTLGPS